MNLSHEASCAKRIVLVEELMEEERTGAGDGSKRQLEAVGVEGPSHGQEGAGAGTGVGALGWCGLRRAGVRNFINV